MVTFFAFMQRHKIGTAFGLLAMCVIIFMAVTGTLSYPYIMVDRQVQSIRHCTFGQPVFETADYGFRLTVSPGLCILPHRVFPLDGSIQILPKSFYFVGSEYAKGSVALASKGTYLFERTRDGRTVSAVMDSLRNGGFLEGATTEVIENRKGITMTVVHHASGLESGPRFNWAFAMNKKGDTLLSVLQRDEGDEASFRALIDGVDLLP
jgi:hypothetical protein